MVRRIPMKFNTLSEEHLELIKDTTKTGQEICNIIGCGIITVSRWRKKLNVDVKKGCKVGKSKPWSLKQKEVICATCNNIFHINFAAHRKYCSRKCMHKNEDYLNTIRSVDRSYMQTEEYKKTRFKKDTPEFRRYRNRVTKLTEQTYMMNKKIINPNGYKRTLAGIEDGYHLDHIISCKKGFENNISAEEISEIGNLQMLPWRENIVKGKK